MVIFIETPFQSMITDFSKSITRYPAIQTTDNITGDESFTYSTSTTISGAFYRKEDVWNQELRGLMQNADAILLVLPSVTLAKNDKITVNSEDYRVQSITMRRLGTTDFYFVVQCFKI